MERIRTLPHGRTTVSSFPGCQDACVDYPIIAHCHLDWDWVWQRPQQFLSRLSKRHRILFVEGPKPVEGISAGSICVREVADYPNLLVIQTKVPARRWTDGSWIDDERRRLLQTLLAEPVGRNFASPLQWFYDPMAVSAFAGQMDEIANVYDCMDQLSQFAFSPPELVRREQELLAVADVVFAGGPKIWKDKRRFNPNCFMYGCGVDAAHFGTAQAAECVIPNDVANLPGPIFGYIGVVDERIDYNLIAGLAESRPEGSVVMIGPTTKVSATALPQRSNLHWLGARDYASLPAYAKAFDVCLMPFALNEATQYINPTKAFEYMATGKPIVSTGIADVILQFSDVITIANSPEDFIEDCFRLSHSANAQVLRHGLRLAASNSWDSIVRSLERHIQDALSVSTDIAISAA